MSATTTTQSRTLDSTPDDRLIAAVREGEQRAAAELVGRHGPALGRFLYSCGADVAEVDDLVQETFFRAFRRLHGWRQEASFRSWLFTIGSNLLKDFHRGQRRRHLVPLEDEQLIAAGDPQADFAAGELNERLRQGIAALARLQREVFLLRALEGGSYDEIAVALGTTAGAARVHYHQAVKRLKEVIR